MLTDGRILKLIIEKLSTLIVRRAQLVHKGSGIYKKKYLQGNKTPRVIFFDFLDRSTHLGDRMFFAHLFSFCNENKIKVLIDSNDSLSIEIFSGLNFYFDIVNKPLIYDVRVLPMPSILRKKPYDARDLFIDFTKFHDADVSSNLIHGIFMAENKMISDMPKIQKILTPSKKLVIFSPYVDSGFFRINNKKKKLLYESARSFLDAGRQVVLVGTKADKINDTFTYNDQFIDLRGRTSVAGIVNYFSLGEVETVISFDNFLMHLAEYFEVPSLICFRGRFFKKNTRLHLNTINVACKRGCSRISYL